MFSLMLRRLENEPPGSLLPPFRVRPDDSRRYDAGLHQSDPLALDVHFRACRVTWIKVRSSLSPREMETLIVSQLSKSDFTKAALAESARI